MYRERRDAMLDALDDLMPAGARWNVPDGGFYVWVTLPDGPRRQGDAAAGGDRAGRVRARARRSSPTASGAAAHAAVVLLPDARADPRGRAPARRRRSRRRSSCAQTFGAGARPPGPAGSTAGYDGPDDRT